MIHLEEISQAREIATIKWREYRQAIKNTNNDNYKDLAKAYNQLKNGRKLIDIAKVIQKGGVDKNTLHPKLAIAQAKSTEIRCEYSKNGSVNFINKNKRWEWHPQKSDVSLINCLPIIPDSIFENQFEHSFRLKAPVPLIPPSALPKKITNDYYILWEVDVWKKIPPTDPYLLKRITNNLFVVLAGWDLTEIEKAVMSGRMI